MDPTNIRSSQARSRQICPFSPNQRGCSLALADGAEYSNAPPWSKFCDAARDIQNAVSGGHLQRLWRTLVDSSRRGAGGVASSEIRIKVLEDMAADPDSYAKEFKPLIEVAGALLSSLPAAQAAMEFELPKRRGDEPRNIEFSKLFRAASRSAFTASSNSFPLFFFLS